MNTKLHSDPRVTVLIPTRNRATLLAVALQSLLDQTLGCIRVIVSDNNSDDNTRLTIEMFSPYFNDFLYVRQEKDIGVFENFKYLFSCVETEYFAVISDDDYMLPNMLNVAITELDQRPEIAFAFQKNLWMDSHGRYLADQKIELPEQCVELKPLMGLQGLLDNRIPYIWTSYVFRKELRNYLIELDYSDNFDTRFLFKIFIHHNCLYIPEIGAIFRSHQGSMSSGLRRFNPELFFSDQRYLRQILINVCIPASKNILKILDSRSVLGYIRMSYREYFVLLFKFKILKSEKLETEFGRFHYDLFVQGFPTIPEQLKSERIWKVIRVILYGLLRRRILKQYMNIRRKRMHYKCHFALYQDAVHRTERMLSLSRTSIL